MFVQTMTKTGLELGLFLQISLSSIFSGDPFFVKQLEQNT